MRQTHPVIYVAEFENVASGGGTASVQVNFNDSGCIRGLTYQAIDLNGAEITDGATLNVFRQNQKGLTTQALLVGTFTGDPQSASAYTLPPAIGNFRVNELDQLVFQLTNKSAGTNITLAHVAIFLEADGPG